MKKSFDSVYEFMITLKGITPLIWRRVQVPGAYSFWDLHVAIQDAMGWCDCHLHEFELDDPSIGKTVRIGMLDDDSDVFDEGSGLPEEEENISDWLSPENSIVRYVYDFGDCWEHEVKLERVLPREKGVAYPGCIAGDRACPPEDCGGIPGYEELLAIMGDTAHEEHARLLEWLGVDFDPERFCAEEVRFDDPLERGAIAFGRREGIVLPLLHARIDKRSSVMMTKQSVESQSTHVIASAAVDNKLRLDIVSLLTYIDSRELRLTQAGNLPLIDVRAINALLVEPEELDHELGGRIYKLRTEDEAPRVRFLRTLSQEAGLTKVRHNKLSATQKVADFLAKQPLDQMAQLFTAWLTKNHWGRMTGWPELVEPLMHKAYNVAYYVSRMPVCKRIEYDIFEKELLDTLRLEVATDNLEDTKRFSYIAIAVSILVPLESFGIISVERVENQYGFNKIAALQLTELGRYLLVG